MKIEVKPTGEKDKPWGLYINDNLFGYSKARFDADFAKNVLDAAVGKVVAEQILGRELP